MTRFFPSRPALVSLAALALLPLLCRGADVLKPGHPVRLPGPAARFDFLNIDTGRNRLLAAHPGAGALEVVALDGTAVNTVATGAAQDCVVTANGAVYMVSVSRPAQLAIVDAGTLKITGTVALPGPADLLAVSPGGTAYVCHDDAKEIWVVSPGLAKVEKTLALPGAGPEGVVLDALHVFQAVKGASAVAVFALPGESPAGTWPTVPAQAPHGMVLVKQAEALAVAGGNGKLVLMSTQDGKVESVCDIPPRVDEIAYDAVLHRIYCASGLGKIAVVECEDGKLTRLGEAADAQGAHSIAVDPQTHLVWVAYMTPAGSWVQSFKPAE